MHPLYSHYGNQAPRRLHWILPDKPLHILDVDKGESCSQNLPPAPELAIEPAPVLRQTLGLVENQMLRSSSRKLDLGTQDFFMATPRGFNVKGIWGQREKAQKIHFCHQRWKGKKSTFICQLHVHGFAWETTLLRFPPSVEPVRRMWCGWQLRTAVYH